jgi:hypothetical protein
MRQREIGIGGERTVEQRLGADIGRQQQIDGRDVIRDGRRRDRGNRKIETVGHFHARPSPV